MAEQHSGCRLHSLQTDRSGKYVSRELSSFLDQKSIFQTITCAYTTQQYGAAERMNRTILSTARALLKHKSVPKVFRADAVATVAFIRNRVTCAGIPSHTAPVEIWTDKMPVLALLRVFGSPCC